MTNISCELFYCQRRLKGYFKPEERSDYNLTENELSADVEKYRPMLFRLAYSSTGDLSVCDDIVWTVFMKLYSYKGVFDSENGKKAWLIRLTINESHNHTRSWWQKNKSELSEAVYRQENLSDDIIALKEAMRTLKPAYREVIYLHYYEGYSSAEIGKMLNLSVTSVTTRLHRGREKLKEYLTD